MPPASSSATQTSWVGRRTFRRTLGTRASESAAGSPSRSAQACLNSASWSTSARWPVATASLPNLWRVPRERDEPVRLTRIYTRGGDRGETSLGDGSRVSKLDPRIAAYGAVDELELAPRGRARRGAPERPPRSTRARSERPLRRRRGPLRAVREDDDRLRVSQAQVARSSRTATASTRAAGPEELRPPGRVRRRRRCTSQGPSADAPSVMRSTRPTRRDQPLAGSST